MHFLYLNGPLPGGGHNSLLLFLHEEAAHKLVEPLTRQHWLICPVKKQNNNIQP